MAPKRKQQEKQTKCTSEIPEDIPDDPPEDFVAVMWSMLKSIKVDMKATQRLDRLEERVSGLESDKKVSELTRLVDHISNVCICMCMCLHICVCIVYVYACM